MPPAAAFFSRKLPKFRRRRFFYAENRQNSAAGFFPPKIAKMTPILQFEDSWGIWPANIKYFGPKCRQWTATKKDIKCKLGHRDIFTLSDGDFSLCLGDIFHSGQSPVARANRLISKVLSWPHKSWCIEVPHNWNFYQTTLRFIRMRKFGQIWINFQIG